MTTAQELRLIRQLLVAIAWGIKEHSGVHGYEYERYLNRAMAELKEYGE